VPEPEEFRESQQDPLDDLRPDKIDADQSYDEVEIPSGLNPNEAADEGADDELEDPDNRLDSERLETAMAIYDELRLVLESLDTIEADLDEPELDRWEMVRARSKEHLEVAASALNDLARLMQDLHLRPDEDSSDDAFLTPEG
jgi:hypothetical protein